MRSLNDYREILSGPLLDSPDFYHVEKNDKWAAAIQNLTKGTCFFTPNPDSITVYGRKVTIPWHNNTGTAYFEFNDICGTPLAAADYISLASRYHTFILDNVPALKITQKNEARRFITLLDALYECKCNLVIRAEVYPDDLFFKDVRDQIQEQETKSIDQEMFSEVHQDLSEPFRPNVSSYDDATTNPPEDPSNKFFPPQQQDFTKISAFTGEDERFAYKRAVSRLKEMTGSFRWTDQPWNPVDEASRPWETFSQEPSTKAMVDTPRLTGNTPGLAGDDNAPKFDSHHFWAMVEWGPGNRVQDEHAKKWIRGNDIYKK